MKNLALLLTIVTITFSSGLGNLEFGGYLENKTSLMIAEEELFSDVATLRLEGSWKFGERGGIETHILFSSALQPLDPLVAYKENSKMQAIMGQLMTVILPPDLLDELSEIPVSVDEDQINTLMKYLPYSTLYPRDKFILDRALIKLYFKPFDLFLGKQTIAWGTGYAFNPTDIWNRKSPLDPNAPKAGVNAFRMEIPFGSVSGLSLVAAPGADFEHSSGGLRLKWNIGGFDLSVSGMRVVNTDLKLINQILPEINPEDTVGDEYMTMLYETISAISDRKIIAGIDLAGQIGDVGVWAEAAVINPVYADMKYSDFDSIYAQVDAGLDYSFGNGLYLMLEYYYNGLGQFKSENYSYRDFIYMFSGEIAGFGQNYLFSGFRKDFLDYFAFSLFGLGNLNDQSAMLLPGIDYDFHDNITVKLSGQIGIGEKEKTEYGSIHSSVLFTVTGYF